MTHATRFHLRVVHAALVACCTAALLHTLPALALTEKLDDSASPQSRVQMPMQWAASADSSLATAQGRIEYRLSTARYAGKQARVYFVIPPLVPGLLSPTALQVEWRGQGPFAPGKAHPGGRSLVWAGTVTNPWLADTLDLRLQLDTRGVKLMRGMDFGFEPYFEIEVMP